MFLMQMEEDHDGEDERYDPDSDMELDDERYIYFICAFLLIYLFSTLECFRISFCAQEASTGQSEE